MAAPLDAEVSRIARGAGWMLPATLLGNALLLLLDLYVNGVLGNSDYGVFGAVKRVLQLAAFVGLLGMENAVIRAVAVARDEREAAAATRTAFLATGLASLAVAVVVMALPFPTWLSCPREVLTIGVASLPFGAARLVAVSAAQGRGAMAPRAIVMFVAWPLAQFGLIAALGRGLPGVMWAYTGAMALGAGLALAALGRSRTAGSAPLGPMMAIAWPLWIQGLVMGLYTWLDQILLESLRSPEDAGWYGPVATLAPLFGVGLGALNGAFAPVIARRHAAGDHDGLGRLYRVVTRWAVAVAVPPLVVCAVAPEAVLSLWPNGSPQAATALRIICASQLFATAVGSVNYLLIMSGRQRGVLVNGIPAVVVNLGLSAALIPALGVTGAALANAAATVTANGVAMWQVWSGLRLHPFDRGLFRMLVAGVPAAGAVWALGTVASGPVLALIGGLAAGLVFVATIAAMGFEEADRMVLDAARRKLGGG